jgi:hypothetical protein
MNPDPGLPAPRQEMPPVPKNNEQPDKRGERPAGLKATVK